MPRKTAGQKSAEKRRRKRNALTRKKEAQLCDGGTCCQAITQSGKQCIRRAKIQLDLTKGKKFYGIEVVPKTGCCFFCIQHAAINTGYAMYKIGWLLAESNLGWDEYITLHPEYLDKKMKEMSGRGYGNDSD